MTEIIVRTSKGVYQSEETIYGVVYLNVKEKTPAKAAVVLRFVGCESYTYQDRDGTRKEGRRTLLNSDNNYLFGDLDSPIDVGLYAFPFKLLLQQDLPGSFYYKDQRLVCGIKYYVEAELTGVKLLNRQEFYIKQTVSPPLESNIATRYETVGIFRKQATFTVRTDETSFPDNEKFKLYLSADNVKCNRPISTNVKILENLHINTAQTPRQSVYNSADRVTIVKDESILDLKLDIPVSENRDLMLYVPLGHISKDHSSTIGRYIQCEYVVEVSFWVSDSKCIVVTLPLPSVYKAINPQWIKWTPPDWVYDCQLVQKDHALAVHQSLLWTQFDGFPGFQVL